MTTTVRLDPSIEARLDALSSETGRTKSFYLRQIIEKGIDQIEYEYGLLKDIEEFRADHLTTYSLDDIKKHHELGD